MITTRPSLITPRRGQLSAAFLPLLFAALFAALTPSLAAQDSAGTVTGAVLDAGTGKFLEGADVTMPGTNLFATTERQGSFTLRNVPAGPHTVVVSYPGLEAKSVSVTVASGQTARVSVNLSASEIVTLNEFKVAGTKEGMSQAIALQKASDNVKVVAAGDQYGDIAEGNAAEYIKFLPGVGIDYNANDARAATLRGMSTAFTNVTMNGNPVASATSGALNRRFEFEQMAINNVETVEVFKTLTPEMPANSTGGSINLVTKSAFDRQGSLFTYRTYLQATSTNLSLNKTEGWGQEKTRKILPGVDLNYASRLSENLGFNLAYKNSQLFNNYPRSTYSWQFNPASGGTPTHPWLSNWNMQNEQKNTRRQSLSGQVDYKVDDRTKVSLNVGWNFYDLLFTDRVTTITPGALPALATTSAPIVRQNGQYFGAAGKGSANFQMINRWKSGVTWNAGLNATHDFANGAKLDASAYWSQAYSKYRDTTGSWYSDINTQRTGLTVNFVDVGELTPHYTTYDSTGAIVDLRDLSQFSVSQIRSRPQTGVDTKSGFSLDYKLPLKTKVPLTVKVGGRADQTGRNIDSRVYNRTGTSVATGFGGANAITGAALTALTDTTFSQHGIGYGQPAYNFPSVYRAYDNLGGLNFLPYTPGSGTSARFDEQTNAGYLRLDAKPIEKLLVVAGTRYENRQVDIENCLPTLPRILHGNWSNKQWFPSINLKYSATNNLLFRFGAAQSIGLPDYSDLLPGTPNITEPTSTTRGRVSLFNPNLEAYQVVNYDAGIEYYFSHSGYVSASVFRKKLSNYIISVTQTLDAASASELGIGSSDLGSPFGDYDVSYKFNIPDAGYYNGIELGYSQNFSFLPKPFNTLGLQVNATFLGVDPIKTNAVLSNSATDPNLNAALLTSVNKNLELAAVKRAFNVTLNYSIGKFGFTVTSNYTGYVLKSASRVTVKYTDVPVNQYVFQYQSQAPRELIDVRMDYKYSRKFTPYFQARNVFGRPIITTSNLGPVNHAEYGDPIYELGVRGAW
jgi:TonB-dependent receptor